jgi:hypothetical protein
VRRFQVQNVREVELLRFCFEEVTFDLALMYVVMLLV